MLVACYTLPQLGIAVERSRRPHLWGEPLVLAADGSVAIASDEAEKLGVRAGQSVTAARSFCSNLEVTSYDRPLYEEAARLIWDLLAIESSVVEPESPETVFVELGSRSHRDNLEIAQRLACAISSSVGIPVQVGLAKTKFLARQAALKSRDATVLDVPIGAEAALLSSVPIESLPQLDVKTRLKLQKLGVRTLGDVLALPAAELRRQFKRVGWLIQRLAIGECGERVRPRWPPRSIEHGMEFEDEMNDHGMLDHAITECCGCISAQIMIEREYCRRVRLTLMLNDRTYLQESERLSAPIADACGLFITARRLLCRMRVEQPVGGVWLTVSDLGAGSGIQMALMDERGLDGERRSRLEDALAYLRHKFGLGAVVTLRMLKEARRIGLWTYPLTHRFDEPIQVATDHQGLPVRYWRGDRRGGALLVEIRKIQNRWKETKWFWGSKLERTVYRVETDPSGLHELHQLGIQWRLGASAD